MKSRALLLTALAGFAFLLSACRTPPVPKEAKLAEDQANELWRAKADVYVPDGYREYLSSLRLAKDKLISQKAKIGWLRDYKEVQADFLAILEKGQALLEEIEAEKASQRRELSVELRILRQRSERIRNFILSLNETDQVRRSITRAELALREAETLLEKEKYIELRGKIRIINIYLGQAQDSLFSVLARYMDDDQIETWRNWAEQTIAESRKNRGVALIINKLERSLTVYHGGKITAIYSIGLGKYGLSDKLHAGDEATPEGRYRVIKKNPNSRFHKALLLDYPNEEDRKEFLRAKKEGRIPQEIGIGGLIEIHGGGEDSLTGGCIAVENSVMDKLFSEVSVGTPVTIIGSLKSVVEILARLQGN